MFLQLVIFLSVPAAVLGGQIDFENCYPNVPPIESFSIEGCNETSPCCVGNLEHFKASIIFTMPRDSQRILLTHQFKGTDGGFWMDDNQSLCNRFVKPNCPLKQNDTVTITPWFVMPTFDTTEDIKSMEWEFRDENRKVLACALSSKMRIC